MIDSFGCTVSAGIHPPDPLHLVADFQRFRNALLRAVTFQVCAGYAKTELLSGVTTLRSVGGIQAVDSCLRDKILSGKAVGPRILAGNMAVSVPGGHMAGSLAYEATSPEEAAALVRKIARDKPDLIKLMITGGVLDAKCKGEPGELKMSPELVKAACDQAHALGLPVAAHVESPQGVRVALEGGVDTIEHGAAPDEEILHLFKERKACHIATISPALPYAMFDRSVTGASETEQYNGRIVMDGIIACAKACLERGIPVGLGTDTGCPYITHYDMWQEVYYFHKFCGVTNAFALHTATLPGQCPAGGSGGGDRLHRARQMRRPYRHPGEPSGGSESSAPYRSGHGPGKPDPCPQGQKNRESRAGVGQIPVKSKKIRQKEPPQDFHSVVAPLMQ